MIYVIGMVSAMLPSVGFVTDRLSLWKCTKVYPPPLWMPEPWLAITLSVRHDSKLFRFCFEGFTTMHCHTGLLVREPRGVPVSPRKNIIHESLSFIIGDARRIGTLFPIHMLSGMTTSFLDSACEAVTTPTTGK
jgi:hypothetical protein